MKALALAFALLLASGCLSPGTGGIAQASLNPAKTGFAERVVDGDTFVLGSGERVRLIGIDAPEKGEACFDEAKKALEEMVLEKEVLLFRDVSEKDRYGRLVRYVYCSGLFVNLEMVRRGNAFAFAFEPDTSLEKRFSAAEEAARSEGGCIWGNA